MRSRRKVRALAMILTAASLAACLAGLFITVRAAIELVHLIVSGEAVKAAVAPLVSEIAEGLVLGVHYFFVSKFFLHSLKHGVPFTHEGAREIMILGIETICLPILAWIVSSVAYAGIRTPIMVMSFSVYELVLGFALILASYAIEYGTDKIERGQIGLKEIQYMEEHFPRELEEARMAVRCTGEAMPDTGAFFDDGQDGL